MSVEDVSLPDPAMARSRRAGCIVPKGSSMKKRVLLVFTALLMMSLVIVPARIVAQTPAASPSPVAGGAGLPAAVDWLIGQQLDTGAFPGMNGEADAGTTSDAIVALVAAQSNGVDTGAAIDKAIAWLGSEDIALVYEQTGTGQAAKLGLALVAAGQDPANFANTDQLAIVQHGLNPETALYGTGVYDSAYSLMLLGVTGNEIPQEAIDKLVAVQAENGGWAFDGSTDVATTDTNTTAMVIQAMVATGNADHPAVAIGLDFLQSTIVEGGVGYATGAPADANSTALAIQAFTAVDQPDDALVTSLAAFQNTDGSFFYQAADPSPNVFTTVQAIPAMAGLALPVQPGGAATSATPVDVRLLAA